MTASIPAWEAPVSRPSLVGRLASWRRRLGWRGVLAGSFIVFLVIVAIAAPLIAPHPPSAQNIKLRFDGPGGEYLLGGDRLGRDVLARLIYGTRTSLIAGAEALAIGLFVGVPLGMIAAFRGRYVGGILNFVSDALMSVPALLLAVTVVAVLGPGLNTAMLAIGIVFIPRFFRVARAVTRQVREETFVEALVATGCKTPRILALHVLPNIASPIIVQVAIAFGTAVLAEASLSFIGLGAQPPMASWGEMLGTAAQTLYDAPFLIYPPGVMLLLTVLAFQTFGDSLEHAMGSRVDDSGVVSGEMEA